MTTFKGWWPHMVAGMVLALLVVVFPHDALAQKVTFDMAEGATGSFSARLIQMVLLIAVISLAPSILMMVTSFVRIVVVLSFLRSALGVQQTPPNPVIISLALFLTAFVMAPVFEKSYDDGIKPLMAEEVDEMQGMERAAAPFHAFMLKHVRQKDLELFMGLGKIDKVATPEDTPYRVLVPAFMIGELKRAFEIGFLIYIPFLIIDMLIASILMAMGMMMLSPALISLPFKLIFFVLVDGWYLVCGSLVKSFGT